MNGHRTARLGAIAIPIFVVAALLFQPTPAIAAPGDLDPSFGIKGISLTDFGAGTDKATTMAIQADGKYLVAGLHQAPDGSYFSTLVRFNVDGSLDPTFGDGGKRMVPIQGWGSPFSLAVDQSGRIFIRPASPMDHVTCLKPDGRLDTSFASGGVLRLNSGGVTSLDFLALRSDGGLVFAGSVSSNGTSIGQTDICVKCYRPDGSPDTAFSDDGKVTIDLAGGSAETVTSLVIAADGSVVVAGQCQSRDAFFVRLSPAGVPDAGFASNGILVLPGRSVGAIWARPGGSVIAANEGSSELMRLTAAGAVDSTYGTNGVVKLDAAGALPGVSTSRLVLLADGGAYRFGTHDSGYPTYKDVIVCRFSPDGTLDTGFGGNGYVLTDLGGADDCAAGAVGPDGKLVVAGYAYGPSITRAAAPSRGMGLARYDSSPSALARGPRTFALARLTVQRGKKAAFRLRVNALTRRVTVKVRILKGSKAVLTLPLGKRQTNRVIVAKRRIDLPTGTYLWKVYATDLQRKAQISVGSNRLVVR